MKILLAIDDSPCSHAAIESLIAGFRPERGEVKVLHVDDWPKDLPPELAFAQGPEGASAVLDAHEERRRAAADLVVDAKRRLEAAHFAVVTEIRAGDARSEILAAAAEWQADVIVLGSHGRHGIERFLLGSVSDNVVRHATCSVDVVRPAPA